MKIEHIANFKEYSETVATWIFEEFVETSKSNSSFEQILDHVTSSESNTFPMIYIAIENDRCVGTVSIFSNDLKRRMDLTPWLASLFVHKEYREKGIGEKLTKHVIAVVEKLGYESLYLRTEHTSEFYKRRNWESICNTIDENGLDTEVFVYHIK